MARNTLNIFGWDTGIDTSKIFGNSANIGIMIFFIIVIIALMIGAYKLFGWKFTDAIKIISWIWT